MPSELNVHECTIILTTHLRLYADDNCLFFPYNSIRAVKHLIVISLTQARYSLNAGSVNKKKKYAFLQFEFYILNSMKRVYPIQKFTKLPAHSFG